MSKNSIFNITITALFVASILFLFAAEKRETKSLSVASVKSPTTVIVDAGHGGEDGGAVGERGALEKDINLKISKKLELIFNLYGINTDMTRRDDVSLSTDISATLRQRKVADIKKRVEKISGTDGATLISIHQNSFPQDKRCFGAQVFFSGNNINSELLAKCTQSALKSGINNSNNRTEKSGNSDIYILKNVNCPAILVECGFLTNSDELNLLMSETFQTKLASCIASGFFEYQNEK